MESFFRRIGPGRYAATEHTVGPWDARYEHAGPPAALLLREIEALAPRADAAVVRVAVDILGPLPVGELTAEAALLRPGRGVELLGGELRADGRPVLRAGVWRVRTAAAPLPPVPEPVAEPLPLPAGLPAVADPGWPGGYLRAVEWRPVRGGFLEPGPAVVWARPRLPLLADEETSPTQRTLLVADSGSGVGGALDPQRWRFVNPELTVHLHRPPVGEWIALDAVTAVEPIGVGLAVTRLVDQAGPFGRGAQALFVGPR